MKAHTRFSFVALTLGAALSSCVYYPHPVPEMPYHPTYRATPRAVAPPQPAAAEPEAAPAMAPAPAVAPKPAPAPSIKPDPFPAPAKIDPLPAPKPNPKAAPAPKQEPAPIVRKVSTAITKPSMANDDFPAPALQPAAPAPIALPPAPAPVKKPAPAADSSKITNDGPIPVATRVEGDPTRVYNPLDPSKTIRIIDKNGNVFPSGKELKVRGTNYHFYVP